MIEKIKKMIEEQQGRNLKFLKDWERYKTKEVTIFHRQLPTAQKINNKINHDYVGVLVNTKVGHYLGNPIAISLDNSDDNKTQEITKLRRYTAFDRVLTELGIQASVMGYGVCLCYIDENGRFDLSEIDPWSVYFDEELCFRIIAGKNEKGDNIEVIEAYDAQKRYYFSKKESVITPISEFKGMKSNVNHLFDNIPLIKFKNNKEELSETYRVRNIIEVLDKMYSDLASELEQFRLAYIKFKGCTPDEDTIKSMQQTGAIGLPEDSDVDFITKNLNIEGVLSAIDVEVRNVFKFAQTYDAHQTREGYGQLTNLGIHFLMAPINNNCKKTIHYFKEALYQIFTFYSQTTEGKWLDPLELSFDFTLDTPRNILEETQIQQNLIGIVSTETRLKLATFVDDIQKEIEKMEEENAMEDAYERDVDEKETDK